MTAVLSNTERKVLETLGELHLIKEQCPAGQYEMVTLTVRCEATDAPVPVFFHHTTIEHQLKNKISVQTLSSLCRKGLALKVTGGRLIFGYAILHCGIDLLRELQKADKVREKPYRPRTAFSNMGHHTITVT